MAPFSFRLRVKHAHEWCISLEQSTTTTKVSLLVLVGNSRVMLKNKEADIFRYLFPLIHFKKVETYILWKKDTFHECEVRCLMLQEWERRYSTGIMDYGWITRAAHTYILSLSLSLTKKHAKFCSGVWAHLYPEMWLPLQKTRLIFHSKPFQSILWHGKGI